MRVQFLITALCALAISSCRNSNENVGDLLRITNEKLDTKINPSVLITPKGIDLDGRKNEHTIWLQFDVHKNDMPEFLISLRSDLSYDDLYLWPDHWKTWGKPREASWWRGDAGQNQKKGYIVAPFSKKYMASMNFTIADGSEDYYLVNVFVSVSPL